MKSCFPDIPQTDVGSEFICLEAAIFKATFNHCLLSFTEYQYGGRTAEGFQGKSGAMFVGIRRALPNHSAPIGGAYEANNHQFGNSGKDKNPRRECIGVRTFPVRFSLVGSFPECPPERLLFSNLHGQEENANKKQTTEVTLAKLGEVERETRKTMKLKALAQVRFRNCPGCYMRRSVGMMVVVL